MKCSVAMTTYNGEKYIVDLMQSIRMQNRMPDEVIIFDDHSSDRTADIVKKFIHENDFKNWKIIINEERVGWKKNFRRAIRECHEEIVFLADQDDIWMPEKIQKMMDVMESNCKIDLLASNYVAFFDGYNKHKEVYRIRGLKRDDGKVEHIGIKRSFLSIMRPGCTFCFRKELYNELKKKDIEEYPHDSILWATALINNSLYIYNKILIKFRRHGDNASISKIEYGLNRRIAEIDYCIKLDEWAISYMNDDTNDVKTMKIVCSQYAFELKRKKVMMQNSLAQVVVFVFLNCRNYPTIRNCLGDIFFSLHENITQKF